MNKLVYHNNAERLSVVAYKFNVRVFWPASKAPRDNQPSDAWTKNSKIYSLVYFSSLFIQQNKYERPVDSFIYRRLGFTIVTTTYGHHCRRHENTSNVVGFGSEL